MSKSQILVLYIMAFAVPFVTLHAQEGPTPEVGTYGVAFNLPDGGGAGFGLRKMISERTNLGIDVTLDLDRREFEDEAIGTDAATDWSIAVSPDLRLYRDARGPVVPFLEIDALLGYAEESDVRSGITVGAGAGIGVEWFPLDGMSISGSTGVSARFSHDESDTASPASRDQFLVTAFRSQLTLNLYFD